MHFFFRLDIIERDTQDAPPTAKLIHDAQEIPPAGVFDTHDQENPINHAPQDARVDGGKAGGAIYDHGVKPLL